VSPPQPLPTTTEFAEAIKACKKKVLTMKAARREINKMICQKHVEFKGLIQPHVAAIKAIKAQINSQLRASPAMKAYRSSSAKSIFAISKVSKEFGINYRTINRMVGGCSRRDWFQNPGTRMMRLIRVRI